MAWEWLRVIAEACGGRIQALRRRRSAQGVRRTGAGTFAPYAVVVLLTVVACGSSNNAGSYLLGGDGDAGSAGGGSDASLDASSCHPGDVETFVASYHPAVQPRDVCRPEVVQPGSLVTGDPIALFYDDCFGPQRSTFACSAFAAASPAYAACAGCIETAASATSYGPLIVDAIDGFVRANVGGCIELTDPLALSCAKAAQAQASCQAAACAANCPVTDDSSLDAYNQCASQAAVGGCQSFAAAAAGCVDASAVDIAPCLTMTFRDFYDAVVPLFCAALPADASAPAIDASGTGAEGAAPSDGATPADARDDGEGNDATHD